MDAVIAKVGNTLEFMILTKAEGREWHYLSEVNMGLSTLLILMAMAD